MKVVIIGQQDFGKSVLDKFLARGDEVAAVFCAPEKAGGKPDPLKVAAVEKGKFKLKMKDVTFDLSEFKKDMDGYNAKLMGALNGN